MTSAFDKPTDMMVGSNNVGAGWHPLLRELEEGLNELNSDFRLVQVKEKFGGLRYYAEPGDIEDVDEFRRRIDTAETKSMTICELCGKPGENLPVHGWFKTLCKGCRQARMHSP